VRNGGQKTYNLGEVFRNYSQKRSEELKKVEIYAGELRTDT